MAPPMRCGPPCEKVGDELDLVADLGPAQDGHEGAVWGGHGFVQVADLFSTRYPATAAPPSSGWPWPRRTCCVLAVTGAKGVMTYTSPSLAKPATKSSWVFCCSAVSFLSGSSWLVGHGLARVEAHVFQQRGLARLSDATRASAAGPMTSLGRAHRLASSSPRRTAQGLRLPPDQRRRQAGPGGSSAPACHPVQHLLDAGERGADASSSVI